VTGHYPIPALQKNLAGKDKLMPRLTAALAGLCGTQKINHLLIVKLTRRSADELANQRSAGKNSFEPLAQSANLTVKTAFISSGLVFVDQTFAGHVIKNRHSFFVSCFRSAFVATGDCGKNTLYHGAHHGSLTGIALTRFFGLANAFACLGSISHVLSSGLSVLNSAVHYPPPLASRQRLFA